MKHLLLIFCATFYLVSCKDEVKKPKIKKNDLADTIVPAKSVEDALNRVESGVSVTQAAEDKKNAEVIAKKYGEQWDFCTCIVANDSITDAFEGKMTKEQEEKLMKRWDYVDNKCKAITTFDQTIPDQRIAHDRKVAKCLKAAKRKR
jgi:hypothetical protein